MKWEVLGISLGDLPAEPHGYAFPQMHGGSDCVPAPNLLSVLGQVIDPIWSQDSPPELGDIPDSF